MPRMFSIVGALLLSLATSSLAEGSEGLRGSRASMIRQNQIAKEQDFTFLRTPSQVERFVEEGYLEPVEGNEDYRLANVSFPYARPALRTFIERLAAQYREACGEKLVVTSLTRPQSMQPRNAHTLSVHPAGMAVDLRISDLSACRSWLEETLLSLEESELLDITRERSPPHYHVAVFPEAYMAHVGRILSDSIRVAELAAADETARQAAEPSAALAATANSLRPAAAPVKRSAQGSDAGWLVFGSILVAGVLLVRRRAGSGSGNDD